MIIKLSRLVLAIFLIVIALGIIAALVYMFIPKSQPLFLGGRVYDLSPKDDFATHTLAQNGDYSQRYQRPSCQKPVENPYNYQFFSEDPLRLDTLQKPEDAILAYFGILREAAHMEGYTAGCGSIGDGDIPYPYAYELLSSELKRSLSLNQFKDSFSGIGHITLLKVYPAYPPDGGSYYMFEIEVIKGSRDSEREQDKAKATSFAYYYGIVENVFENGGWKLQSINILGEDFLCAPYHGWFYDSQAVMEIVYKENLKIINEITKTERKDDFVYIYAKGNGKDYRFDFVVLTNGHEVLLNENVLDNREYVPVNLLPEQYKNYKLSILAFR
ncbi:MAG TPA: hypothetical protein GXX17_02415 [Clostridiales bacterium]|nr:hypothetical protein [Clostridiales bacterium]